MPSSNRLRNRRLPGAPLACGPIRGALRDPRPLSASVAALGSDDARLFNGLLPTNNTRFLIQNPIADNVPGRRCRWQR